VGLSHCRHDGLVTVWDEAHLRRGHNDQSHWSHQCSETTLTGESRFHIIIPLGFEPGSLMAVRDLEKQIRTEWNGHEQSVVEAVFIEL
jgi:hypothetical protein